VAINVLSDGNHTVKARAEWKPPDCKYIVGVRFVEGWRTEGSQLASSYSDKGGRVGDGVSSKSVCTLGDAGIGVRVGEGIVNKQSK
jgi:hypothetical protein